MVLSGRRVQTYAGAVTSARVPPATGLQARLAVWAAKRKLGPAAVESAAVYAQHPRLLRWFAAFDRAVSKPDRLPDRLHKLAELKAATVVECEFCIDIGSHLAREAGLSDEQLIALHDPEASGLFDADESAGHRLRARHVGHAARDRRRDGGGRPGALRRAGPLRAHLPRRLGEPPAPG